MVSLIGLATIAIITAIGGWPVIIGAAVIGALAAGITYAWNNRAAIGDRFVDTWRSLLFRIKPDTNRIRDLASDIAGAFNSIVSAISRFISTLWSLVPGIGPPSSPSGMPSVPGFTPMPGPGTPGSMHRQGWVPPARGTMVLPIRHELTIDGHTLAQAVSHYIVQGAQHVQSAAQYDGGLGHVPVDIGMA